MKSRTRNLIVSVIVLVSASVAIWFLWQHRTIEISTRAPEREVRIEDFDGLPYLAHVVDDPNPEKKGVTLHNDNLSYMGLNLLTSRLVGGSHLLDMEGNILHSWLPTDSIDCEWIYSEMDEAGNLIALVKNAGLVKLDWNSEVIWTSDPADNPHLSKAGEVGYHHDFEVLENGNIYVLVTEFRHADFPSGEQAIRDDSIVLLNPEGVPEGKIPLYDFLRDLVPESRFEYDPEKRKSLRMPRVRKLLDQQHGADVFHVNTVEEISRDIGIAKDGDLLFCARNLDLIGILDAVEMNLIWSWGPGTLERPHHPTLLLNGNILVFDNGMRERRYSRVLELDPATEKIVWKYEATPPESFFSKMRGGNQRLPNGNTLITESERGHAFEVTESGEIVWDFWNFETNEQGQRGIIYRMVRYAPDFLKR